MKIISGLLGAASFVMLIIASSTGNYDFYNPIAFIIMGASILTSGKTLDEANASKNSRILVFVIGVFMVVSGIYLFFR